MPILRHELTLIARRQHVTLWRCAFVLALALLAGSMYYGASQQTIFGRREVAEITQYIGLALFCILFAIAAIVTPQWTADAIAGERERQTLTFLLLTPLDNRSIILGKLGSRLAQVGVFMLAAVPVMCALQFFGGIPPDLVLMAIATLAATIVSTASIAVVASIYHRTTKAAGQRAAQAVAGYIFGLLLVKVALQAWPQVANFPSPTAAVTVWDVYEWLAVGNPLLVADQALAGFRTGTALDGVLARVVANYVLFHAVVAIVCIAWASRRLRHVAAERGDGPPPMPKSKFKQTLPRPPVSDRRPVTWKMLYCDQRMVRTYFSRGIARVAFVLSFVPLILVITFTLMFSFSTSNELPSAVNSVLRGIGTLALCAGLLHIAGQASVSVARERLKQTLDELLLTDLSVEEILGQKWLAAVSGARWLWVWVGIHWAVGVVTGGLHPLAIPFLMLAWTVYAAAAASLGIYCTATCRTPKQANMWTIGLGAAVAGGPILVTVGLLLVMLNPSEALWMPLAMSPPITLGAATFSSDEWAVVWGQRHLTWSGVGTASIWSALYPAVTGALLGLALNGYLAWWWWRRACRLFPRTVGRD